MKNFLIHMLYCKGTCGCSFITTLHPLDFFASVYEIASRHHGQLEHGGKTIIASSEEKNRKATKNSARNLKANINFEFCEINATIIS